jgi:hypothetical protein
MVRTTKSILPNAEVNKQMSSMQSLWLVDKQVKPAGNPKRV